MLMNQTKKNLILNKSHLRKKPRRHTNKSMKSKCRNKFRKWPSSLWRSLKAKKL